MISRYEGSIILAHDVREFDEFVLPMGAIRRLQTGTGVELRESQRTLVLSEGRPFQRQRELVGERLQQVHLLRVPQSLR